MNNKKYIIALLLLLQLSMTFAGTFINGTMVHGSATRKYVIYVPTIYTTQGIKVPLLVGLHGNGDVVSNFKNICMSSIADTANYIVVYPEALPDPILTTNAWHSGAGPTGYEVNSTVDDVGFINRLMDTVIAKYMIDTSRMYVFGFSFGGFMTNKMAASNAKRFSAAACVSGERGNYNSSIPAVAVPYLHFHGTADSVITYYGNTASFPPLGVTPDSTTRFWAIKNGCSLTPAIDTMPDLAADGLRFIRYTYSNGSNNNKAILYKVVNGVHTWYSRPANDIDYCQTIWAFFRQYSNAVTTTPTPTASFTVSDTTVCKGSSLTFTSTSTASSGSLDSIRWTILGGTPSTATTSPITSTFNTVASYVITLKAYKSGNVSTAVKTIRVKELPVVTVTSPSICAGQTAQPVASGATTYIWTGGLTAVSNPTTPALSTTTTYTVTGTTNRCTGTAVSTVTVKPNPVVTVTSPSICAGKTAQPVASGATTYSWTGGLTAVSNPTTPALSTTTTYTVTGTTNGCTGIAVSTVTVKPNPVVTVTSPGICPGQTAQPVASGATTYTWTGGLTAVSNPTTPVLTTTTTYTVTGTTNGCTGTAISTVTVNSSLGVTVTSPSICAGQTAQPIASGATTYTWTGGLTAVSNPTTPVLTTTTTYTVTGTTNGCTGTAVSTVTVKPNPVVTVTSPSICAGQTAQPIASGATTYTWTGGLTAVSNPTTPVLTTTTTYTVTGTTNGCTGTAVSTVTVKLNPVVTVTSPSICAGQTAQPVASGATTYIWTGGLTTVSNPTTPVLTTTTTYTVTGTTNGCTGTAVSTVTVKLNPVVTVTSPSICAGQTAQPVASGATTYIWTGGLTAVSNPTTPVLTTTTTYTVTGTTNGCTGTATSTVVVKPLPATPTITQRNDSLICSVSGGASYNWYRNGTLFTTSTVPKIKLTQNGLYTIEVVGTNSCVSILSASFNAIITGIKYNKLDVEYSIIPNPNNGSFELSITGVVNKVYQLKMYNINGQTILTDEINIKVGLNSKQINISGVEKGIYFLSIIGDNGMSNQNIIVQ